MPLASSMVSPSMRSRTSSWSIVGSTSLVAVSPNVTRPTITSSGRLSRKTPAAVLASAELGFPCCGCCRRRGRRRVAPTSSTSASSSLADADRRRSPRTESGRSSPSASSLAWNVMLSVPLEFSLVTILPLVAAEAGVASSSNTHREPPVRASHRRLRRHRPNFSKANVVGSTCTPASASLSRNLGRSPVDLRVPIEWPMSSNPALWSNR